MRRIVGLPGLLLPLLFGVLAVILAASAALKYLPYFRYVDETHVIHWIDGGFFAGVPKDIFYGPVIFDFLYLLGLLTSCIGFEGFSQAYGPGATFSSQFVQDISPIWIVGMARIFSLSCLFFTIFFTTKAVQNFTKSDFSSYWTVLTMIFLATLPWHLEVGGYIQPEILILLWLSLLLLLVSKTKQEFGVKDNVSVGILVALLGATKIYALAFGLILLLPIFKTKEPVKDRLRIIAVGVSVCGLTFFALYGPYRGIGGLIDMVRTAGSYYADKTSPPLLRQMFSNARVPLFWAPLLAIGAIFGGRAYARKQYDFFLLFLSVIVIWVFFSLRPYQPDRNVICTPLLLGVFGMLGLREITRNIRWSGVRVLLLALVVWGAFVGTRRPLTQVKDDDSRLELTAYLNSFEGKKPPLILDPHTQLVRQLILGYNLHFIELDPIESLDFDTAYVVLRSAYEQRFTNDLPGEHEVIFFSGVDKSPLGLGYFIRSGFSMVLLWPKSVRLNHKSSVKI